MELREFVDWVAAAIPVLDQTATTSKPDFLPGVGTLEETQFRDLLVAYIAANRQGLALHPEVCYPEGRRKCDLCVGPCDDAGRHEWAIELKKISFVGDNGKNNDYGPSKVVSPYLIHRSSVYDALRLRTGAPGARRAIVMYGFEFDRDVAEGGRAICVAGNLTTERADNLSDVLDRNGGDYLLEPTFRMFEAMRDVVGLKLGDRVEAVFGPLLRHPVFQRGRVAAWEVLV